MIKERRITNIPYQITFFIVCFIVLPLGLAITWYEYQESLDHMKNHENELFRSMKSELLLELESHISRLGFYYEKSQEKQEKEVEQDFKNIQQIVKALLRKGGGDTLHGKQLLKQVLTPMRFGGGKGYFFAFSPDGTARILPLNSELEGKNILDLKDPEGREVVREMLRLIDDKGQGIIRYRSFIPDDQGRYPGKIAFIKQIFPLDWIFGAVKLVGDVDARLIDVYMESNQKLYFHKSDFQFIQHRPDSVLIQAKNARIDKEKFSAIISKKLTEAEGDCFQLYSPGGDYLVCSRDYPPLGLHVGVGVAKSRIQKIIEKERAGNRHQLELRLIYSVFVIIIVAVAVIFIGHQVKRGIDQGFGVFAAFFKTASSENTKIDVNALEIIEFKQLASYANTMVENMQAQDRVIKTYTEKLETANRELEELASRDSLTSLHNRRYFDEAFSKEIFRGRRYGAPLALIMVDIDCFKGYNDAHGHLEGDVCLKKVAGAMAGAMRRPADLVARFGGEEFVILLPDTDEPGLLKVAGILEKKVSELAIPHKASTVSDYVTVSMGIALLPSGEKISPGELLSRADRALYQAKHQGRDQFVIF